MGIGEQIIHLREKRNWSQRELARRSGINVSVMNRIEKGIRPVTDQEIKLLADLFDVSTDYLLGVVDSPRPPKKLEPAKVHETENLHFFNLEGLSEEEIEEVEKYIEVLRLKAKRFNEDFKKDNK
jgi:transcriptional regulator with XRE-family HTH domain